MDNISLPPDLALEILEVLRLTPIYTLLDSDEQELLGTDPYDFKPEKWWGSEREHADRAYEAFKALLALCQQR